MTDRKRLRDVRINVLRADEVGVWHHLLALAQELDKPDAPFRSVRLGCFDVIAADGRTGRFSPALMAQIFELPLLIVGATIDKLIELGIVGRDGKTLWIEDAADWFVPAIEHPALRN